MPPRNISVTSDEDALDGDERGPAPDAPHVRAAQRQYDALRAEISRGLEALARGDYVEIDERDLRAFLADVSAAGPRSAR